MLKKSYLGLSLLVAILLIAGCGKKDESNPSDQKNSNEKAKVVTQTTSINTTLDFKGVKIGMPGVEALALLKSNGASCTGISAATLEVPRGEDEQQVIANFIRGDEYFRCDISIFNQIVDTYVYLVDKKVFFVLGDSAIRTTDESLPPSVWKAISEKYKIDPTVAKVPIITNPDKEGDYKYYAEIVDPSGSILSITGTIDPADGQTHPVTTTQSWLELESKDLPAYQKSKEEALNKSIRDEKQKLENKKKSDL